MIGQRFYALRETAFPRPAELPPGKAGSIFAILQEASGTTTCQPRRPLEITKAMQTEDARMGPGQRCPVCDRPLGPLTWLPPYRIEIETWGTAFGDVIVRNGNTLVVSELFRRAFEQNGLRAGGDFEEVEVAKITRHRHFAEDPPRYFKLTIHREKVRVNQGVSEFTWTNDEPPCSHCLWSKTGNLKSYRRIVVEEGTWTGEDVFQAHGSPLNFIVTDRFKTMCDANFIRNVEFEAVENCSWEKPAWEP